MNLFLITALTTYGQQFRLPGTSGQAQTDSLRKKPLQLIPGNYYSSRLAFFCKKELQLEKLTKVSIKIRLGSTDYVDRLEGKRKN
ncbi:hypothetical protein [Sediminibacterium ginsengisoli]|uniref:hypothetical protein n=1 Tax=Sediminibacterium ginsengisoli TaxID=413434 RepID=UPI001116D421|nr:hypothetical protein [Sediminibacterium ginsengisoli]